MPKSEKCHKDPQWPYQGAQCPESCVPLSTPPYLRCLSPAGHCPLGAWRPVSLQEKPCRQAWHAEGTVCFGRLEKVPVGHRMGLCNAEAEDTGRPQVWGMGSSWAAGLDPASEMDGAIMALPIGPTSAQPPGGPPLQNMQQVKRPQTSSPCNWRGSSGLITPRANESPVRQGHCHHLSAIYTKQLKPQQAPSAFWSWP